MTTRRAPGTDPPTRTRRPVPGQRPGRGRTLAKSWNLCRTKKAAHTAGPKSYTRCRITQAAPRLYLEESRPELTTGEITTTTAQHHARIARPAITEVELTT